MLAAIAILEHARYDKKGNHSSCAPLSTLYFITISAPTFGILGNSMYLYSHCINFVNGFMRKHHSGIQCQRLTREDAIPVLISMSSTGTVLLSTRTTNFLFTLVYFPSIHPLISHAIFAWGISGICCILHKFL